MILQYLCVYVCALTCVFVMSVCICYEYVCICYMCVCVQASMDLYAYVEVGD